MIQNGWVFLLPHRARSAPPLLPCALTAACMLLLPPAEACQVPVFRYALERWDPDPLSAVVFHPGEPSDALLETIAILETAATRSNMSLEIHRTDTLTEAQLWSLDRPPADPQRAVIQVFRGSRSGQRRLCLDLDANPQNAALLVDSPARQTLVRALSNGSSAVWILLEGSDPVKNAEAWATLTQSLDEAASSLELPEGVIPSAAAAAAHKQSKPIEMDDVLRSGIPLRIEFTPQRVARDDPAESALIAQFESLRPLDPAIPYAVPIFGRGRFLPPLAAAPLDPAAVAAACRYLTEVCSCQVKSENPGADLLLRADWDSLLDQSLVVIEKALPPLEGAGVLLVGPASVPLDEVTLPAAAVSAPARLFWAVLGFAAILLTLLVSTAAAIFLLRRPRP